MPKQTYIVTTGGGEWATLAAGEATVVSLVANTAAVTLVALRIRLANGDTGMFLPLNSLPSGPSTRVALSGISLKPGDRLEALSNGSVDWVATAITGVAYLSKVATSIAGEVWAPLVVGPATVRGIYASVASAGQVSVVVRKGAKDVAVVSTEPLPAGGSKRFMAPIVLAAGESIQVKGSVPASWVATGVEV